MIETITPPSRAGGTGFERTEIQNRKIVGTIRDVGHGDCYTLTLWWKMEIVSGIIKMSILLVDGEKI